MRISNENGHLRNVPTEIKIKVYSMTEASVSTAGTQLTQLDKILPVQPYGGKYK